MIFLFSYLCKSVKICGYLLKSYNPIFLLLIRFCSNCCTLLLESCWCDRHHFRVLVHLPAPWGIPGPVFPVSVGDEARLPGPWLLLMTSAIENRGSGHWVCSLPLLLCTCFRVTSVDRASWRMQCTQTSVLMSPSMCPNKYPQFPARTTGLSLNSGLLPSFLTCTFFLRR